MSFLKNAVTRVHEFVLLKKLKEEDIQRRPTDFALAKEIGILFDSRLPEQLDIVKGFIKKLKDQGKKVKLLAFFDDNSPHGNFPFKTFNRKDVDWKMQPNSSEVLDFIQYPFDILINLSLMPHLPLEYVAALSHAHLRVGPATEKTYCYELIVDVPDKRNLNQLIQQIEFFLNRLNSPRYENASA